MDQTGKPSEPLSGFPVAKRHFQLLRDTALLICRCFSWENEGTLSRQVFPLRGGRSRRGNHGSVPSKGTGPLPTGDAGEVNKAQLAANRDQEQPRLLHLSGDPHFTWEHTGTPSELWVLPTLYLVLRK